MRGVEDVDRDQPPVRNVAVQVRLVAEARDRYVEAVAAQREAAPHVLGAGQLDDSHWPAADLLAGRQAQRMEQAVGADGVQAASRPVEHRRRGDAVRDVARGDERGGAHLPLPEDAAVDGTERGHGAGVGGDEDRVLAARAEGHVLGVERRRHEASSHADAPVLDDVAHRLRREPAGRRGRDVVRDEVTAAVARPVGRPGNRRYRERESGAANDRDPAQCSRHHPNRITVASDV